MAVQLELTKAAMKALSMAEMLAARMALLSDTV